MSLRPSLRSATINARLASENAARDAAAIAGPSGSGSKAKGKGKGRGKNTTPRSDQRIPEDQLMQEPRPTEETQIHHYLSPVLDSFEHVLDKFNKRLEALEAPTNTRSGLDNPGVLTDIDPTKDVDLRKSNHTSSTHYNHSALGTYADRVRKIGDSAYQDNPSDRLDDTQPLSHRSKHRGDRHRVDEAHHRHSFDIGADRQRMRINSDVDDDSSHRYTDERRLDFERRSGVQDTDIDREHRGAKRPYSEIYSDYDSGERVWDQNSRGPNTYDSVNNRSDRRLAIGGRSQLVSEMTGLMCGASASAKLRQKIARDEYFDIGELDMNIMKRGGEESYTLELDRGDRPSIVKNNGSKRSLSFNQWSRCFHKLMSIYLDIHGGGGKGQFIGMEMCTYHETVRELWEKNARWDLFDINFRQLRETSPCSWADKDVIVQLRLMYGNPSPHHHQQSTPGFRSKSSGKPPNLEVPRFYCSQYHLSGQCTREKCHYNHYCYKCEDKKTPHSASRCNKKPLNSNNTNKSGKQYIDSFLFPFIHHVLENSDIYDTSINNFSSDIDITVDDIPVSDSEDTNSISHNIYVDSDILPDIEYDISQATPVIPQVLHQLFDMIDYDSHLAAFLVNGFTEGFKLGHAAPLRNNLSIPSVSSQEMEIIQGKLDVEIKQGRMAGPFPSPPFKQFQVSPLFLRPKSTPGEYRMILNLSYPRDLSSINSNISDVYKSVKYSSVRAAIKDITDMGKGVYTAKVDVKDAFRLLPIHKQDIGKLCFKNKGNITLIGCFPKAAPAAASCLSSLRLHYKPSLISLK